MPTSENEAKRIAFVVSALDDKLQFGKRDATRIFELLTDPKLGMCNPRESKLIPECQDHSEFTKALSSILKDWNQSNQLILYFSGHGNADSNNKEYYLEFLDNDILPFQTIISTLNIRKVSRAILILDTCHSGAAIDGSKSFNENFNSIIQAIDIPQGIAIIASSKASQISRESPDDASSIFTHLFCKGIKSGLDNKPTPNGLITVSDIVTYIHDKLENDKQYSEFYQRPVYRVGKSSKEIWLTINPTASNTPKDKSTDKSTFSPVKQFRYRDNPNFVGREAQLTELHQQLQQPEIVAITAVAGMGGVGKTELASRYSHKHESEYSGGICWLDARGENLAAAVVQFAQLDLKLEVPQIDFQGKPLNLTQQVVWCWQNWQPPEGLVLVILDDVTDLALCRDFFPTSNRFRVLITTRLRHLDTNIKEIPLDVLSPEEALQLLTVLEPKRVQREPETAQELCEWLGYLPLGIDLVGRYLAKKPPQWTFAKMLERLKTQSIEDEALNPQLYQTLSTAQRGVKAAFELSWQELQPQTQQIAEFLSLFAPSMFAWEWVEAAASELNWHSVDVETANQQLNERHLIQWVEDREDGYKIHPLIREFLKAKLKVSSQAEDLKQVFADIFVAIAEEIPYQPTLDIINSSKDAIPHLAQVAENLLDIIDDDNLIWVFNALGWFYQGQVLYALAEPWLQKCIPVLKSRLGEEHPDVATSLNNLAELYYFQGRYKEAEPINLQALELYKRSLGEEHPNVALTVSNLALLYYSQGRYKEAENLNLQALELYKCSLGEEHPNVAQSLNNLAELYRSQGRYEKAEPINLQALELYKRSLGEEHPNVAQSLNNLAELYRSQGRYKEAENLNLQALELYKRSFGEEHPNVAQSLNNLALLYYSQGQYEKAEPINLQALELYKRSLGEEHPNVALTVSNLALLYYSQGRYKEAEPINLQALELYKRSLGEEHPNVAQSLNNLAELYRSQGRYEEAEPMFLQALELYKRSLGEEHPNVAQSLNNLAKLYRSQGRYEEAEPMFLQALAINKRLLGEQHPYLAAILNNLAGLYRSQERYGEAEHFYLQALEIAEQSLGANHPNTIISRENLESLRDELNSL